jgi:hypothetical protein
MRQNINKEGDGNVGADLEEEGSTLHRNLGNHLPDYAVTSQKTVILSPQVFHNMHFKIMIAIGTNTKKINIPAFA